MLLGKLTKWTILAPLVLFLSLLVSVDYLRPGFPYTHDGENHLARFANYKIALKEGQFPPRLAPNLLNHYGYPVFNYNYPLANILSLPFSLLGINYEATFKTLLVLSLIFGGVGVIKWLRSLTLIDQENKLGLIFALGVYYSSNYLINMVLFRGNIGEVLAFALFPWVLFWLKNKTFSPVFIVIWVAFLLSHNLMAFFGSIICLIIWLFEYKKHLKVLKQEVLFFGLIFALSSWFWWPAVLELNLVAAGHSQLVTLATEHFPTLKELLFAPLQFGFSYPGSVDSLGFSLGAAQWLVVVASVLVSFLGNKKARLTFPRKFLSLFGLMIFLELPISLFFWRIIPILSLLQFPWRLSFFASILLLPLASWVFFHSSKQVRWLLLIVLFSQIIIQLKLVPLKYFHKSETEYDLFPQTTTTDNENMPEGFKYLLFGDWQPTPQILEGAGKIEVNSWTGSSRNYQLNLSQESLIVEPTVNFLGWQTQVAVDAGKTKVIEYLNNEEIQGRLAYKLPAGQWLVQTKFTQNTLPRIVGNGLSLLGVVLFFIYTYKWRQNRKIL